MTSSIWTAIRRHLPYVSAAILGSFLIFRFLGPIRVGNEWIPRSIESMSVSGASVSASQTAALRKLPGLSRVSFNYCTIEDAMFPGAEEITFTNCTFLPGAFKDEPLSAREITIENPEGIDDYSFLEKCADLTSLTLISAGLSDASAPDLTESSVTEYQLTDNPLLTDISWISPDTVSLICAHCGVTSLDTCADFTSLETLVFDGCPVKKVTKPFHSVYMKTLSMRGAGLTDCSGFSSFSILENADVSYNQFDTPGDLPFLTQSAQTLTHLDISGVPLSEKEVNELLAPMNNLERLYADDLALTDLSFAEEKPQLRDLTAIHSGLSDISALEKVPLLRRVRLSFNNIEDISVFDGKTSFDLAKNPYRYDSTLIDLAGNQITDISPLLSMKAGTIILLDNPLDFTELPSDPDTAMADNLLFSYTEGLEDAPLGRPLSDRLFISGFPLNKQVALENAFGAYLSLFETDIELLQEYNELKKTDENGNYYEKADFSLWEDMLS